MDDNEVDLFFKHLDYLRQLPSKEFDYDFFCKLCAILDDNCDDMDGMRALASFIEQEYAIQHNTPELLWHYLKDSFKIFKKSRSLFSSTFLLGILYKGNVLRLFLEEIMSNSAYSHFLKGILIQWNEEELIEEIFGEKSKRIDEFISR